MNDSAGQRGTVDGPVPTSSFRKAALHGGPALLAALIPKCPLCWVAYGSAFGVAGVAPTAWRWAPIAVLILLALSLLPVALRRRAPAPWILAALGAAVVFFGLKSPWAVLGAPFLIAAAIWPVPSPGPLARNQAEPAA